MNRKFLISRYPAYKDSDIEWLGEIPEHWEEKRVKDISFLQSGNNIVSEQIEETGQYPVYGGNSLRGYFSKYTNEGNHILIGRQGALCGNINYAFGKFWATEHAVVVYLKRSVNMKWYGEMLRAMNLNQYSLSAAQPGLAVDRIKRLLLPFPPLPEQKAIANYLDTKTAQIDRKIDLLTEKAKLYNNLKQSLINETVTRGLDKTVPMKDSGIEWIGEIPDHWGIKRLKDLGFLYSGLTGKTGDDFTDEHQWSCDFIPFVNIAYNQYILPTLMKKVIVAPNEKQNKVKKNDLFFLMSSENHEDIGKSSLLNEDISNTYLNSFCKGFRFTAKAAVPNFINYLISSKKYRDSFAIEGKGFTRINLKIEKVNNLFILLPPLPEQKEIAHYLDTKTSQIDKIIETINTQIEKLKELRKTLINDVVTGKIKVV